MSKANLKELSEPFGMTVTKFAETMGYTRQALHAAIQTGDVNHRRMRKELKNMKVISNRIYLKQIDEADKAKKRRELVLASLSKWFGLV